MFRKDVLCSGKVGNGACKLDYACACACGQAHAVDDPFQQDSAFFAQRTVFFQMLVVHCGIGEYPFSLKAFSLDFPCSKNACRNSRTLLRLFPLDKLLRIDFP